MDSKRAIQIALEYIESRPELVVIKAPAARLIPAQFRPTIDAVNDAWLISFPYANTDPDDFSSPLGILVDCVTEEVSIPILL